MRITSKGQVTIPEPIRKKTGLLPGTAELVEAMRGKATVRMSTDQIMRLTRGEE